MLSNICTHKEMHFEWIHSFSVPRLSLKGNFINNIFILRMDEMSFIVTTLPQFRFALMSILSACVLVLQPATLLF